MAVPPPAPAHRTPGPLLFARFAYPPNALGYCGPDDPAALLGHTSAGQSGTDLVALASRFAGAWPYLQLIAASAGPWGAADPLDRAVVEAYWIGNALLNRVDAHVFAAHLSDRFAARAGHGMADIATLALLGAVPHHNFHVFAVYPWVGMLRAGFSGDEPIRVLNSCRVRWGRVHATHDGFADVLCQPVRWDGRTLHLGPAVLEQVRHASGNGSSLTPRIRPGDTVAMHWDWICDVLDPHQSRALRLHSSRILRMANEALRRPVAAAVLD